MTRSGVDTRWKEFGEGQYTMARIAEWCSIIICSDVHRCATGTEEGNSYISL